MNERRHTDEKDWQLLLEWLETESEITPSSQTAYVPKDVDRLSATDRADVLDWLGISDDSTEMCLEPEPERERQAAVAWLIQARAILAGHESVLEKMNKIMAIPLEMSALAILKPAAKSCLKGYRRLPVGVQVALPATALAAPALGGAGVGLAAFGGAIGLPALLVFFLGVAGISSLIADLLGAEDDAQAFTQSVLALLATDAALMRMRAEMRGAVARQVVEPCKRSMPGDQAASLARWLALSSLEFEQHVIGLIAESGMLAWVTPAGSDGGIDGVVKDGERLILVQCKRYAVDHLVGRPTVQQFKGVIEENEADLGVLVTSSGFTAHARESASKSERVILVDGAQLFRWQQDGVSL